MEEIFNNSNDLYEEFVQQQLFCEEVPNIYSENQNNSNMVFDDIHLIATDIVHFIYSAPLYKNLFYVHDKSDENGGRQLVVMPSKEASDDYSNRQQCKMVFFGYDDLMYICKEMSVDYVVMFFKEKTFIYSIQDLKNFLKIYQSQNPESKYIIGKPSESYDNMIEIISNKFYNYKSIKKLWLYHVCEMNNNFSNKIYDVIVIDMPEEDYLLIKSYIENIAYKTNSHSIIVVLNDSEFGKFLLNTKIDPFFTNND